MSEISLFSNNNKVSYLDEMSKSFIDYAMSVITSRALPDIRDGLKPVQRRILLAMYEEGLLKNFSKSAGIVGEVLKKYHPHGDTAVYEALVRLTQNWIMRVPLIDGQGNFGSIDGDSAAAYRYTEAKLNKICQYLLKDIEKDTVDKVLNYNGTIYEPIVFPSVVPNLLINGSSGIAVGMATNIPPHNPAEILNALIAILDDNLIEDEAIFKIVKGPDFPTAATIIGQEGIKEAYLKGKGNFKIRGIIEHEKVKDKDRLVIKEIPFSILKSRITTKIVDLLKIKKIDGISDIRDESDKNGIRLVLDLKKHTAVALLKEKLFKLTPLETSYNINMVALKNAKPKLFSLREILFYFIEFRKEIVRKRTIYSLKKAEEKLNLLDGFKKVLEFKDEYLKKILPLATSKESLKTQIESRFSINSIQSEAVVNLANYKFSSMEISKIIDEYNELKKEMDIMDEILKKEEVLIKIIKNEFIELKNLINTPRLTKIIDNFENKSLKDLIPDKTVLVSLTLSGFVKRYNIDSETELRDTKVIFTGDDIVTKVIKANTAKKILFFSKTGKLFSETCFTLPELRRYGKGVEVSSIINDKDIFTIESSDNNKSILMLSKNGYLKKLILTDAENIKSSGVNVFKLKKQDYLILANKTNYDNLFLISKKSSYKIIKLKDLKTLEKQEAAIKIFEEIDKFFFFDNDLKEFLILNEQGLANFISFESFIKLDNKSMINKIYLPISNNFELIIKTSKDRFLYLNKNKVKLDLEANEKIVDSFIFYS